MIRHLLNHCIWGTRLTSQKADDKFSAKLVEARKIAIYSVIKPGKKSSRSPRAENWLHSNQKITCGELRWARCVVEWLLFVLVVFS